MAKKMKVKKKEKIVRNQNSCPKDLFILAWLNPQNQSVKDVVADINNTVKSGDTKYKITEVSAIARAKRYRAGSNRIRKLALPVKKGEEKRQYKKRKEAFKADYNKVQDLLIRLDTGTNDEVIYAAIKEQITGSFLADE